jgi:hypothetical protein
MTWPRIDPATLAQSSFISLRGGFMKTVFPGLAEVLKWHQAEAGRRSHALALIWLGKGLKKGFILQK